MAKKSKIEKVDNSYSKKDVSTLLKERKITNLDIDIFPEFAMAPACIIIDPTKDPIQVPGRYYTMVTVDDGRTWNPLVEVSEKYKLTSHLDVLGSFLETGYSEIQNVFDEIELSPRFSANKASMHLDIKTKSKKGMVKVNGEDIQAAMSVINSVDLTKKLVKSFRATRLACSNRMRVPDSRFPDGTQSTRHIGDNAEISNFLMDAGDNAKNLISAIKKWGDWTKKPISQVEFFTLAESIGLSEKQIEEIMDTDLRGFKMMGKQAPRLFGGFEGGKSSNFWMAYNAITQWITDNTDNPNTENERSEKAANTFEIAYNG